MELLTHMDDVQVDGVLEVQLGGLEKKDQTWHREELPYVVT